MSTTVPMSPTGRVMIGPASDLVELEDADGVKYTAIVFHPQWREHPAITDALGVIEGFLRSPMVTGLVEMTERDVEQARFVYPTGSVWSVAELIRMVSDRGERGGIRAGLELMYTAGQILVEGAEAGAPRGVYSHGGLSPRRVMVRADGQVMVIGYGLPQVEILQFHATPSQVPREDSFRYCPPERMEARPEDLSSDLFGVCLIAFELMTGKPVYDGLVKDIRQQAARGEGSRRLFRFKDVLPEPVRNVLTKVLRPNPEARYIDGEEFLSDVHTLLSDREVPGPSLMALMAELQSEQRRVGESVQAGSTQMVDPAQLKADLASDEVSVESEPSARWQRRPGRRSVARCEEDLGGPSVIDAPEVSAFEPPEAQPAPLPDAEEKAAPTPSKPDQRWSKVARPIRRAAPPAPLPGVDDSGVFGDAAQDVPTPPMVPPPKIPPRKAPQRTVSSIQPPVVPSPSNPPPTADDLILAIRGEASPAPAPAPVRKAAQVSTAVLSREDKVEVLVDADAEDASATVMMTPAQLREKLQEEDVSAPKPKPKPKTKPKPTTRIESPATGKPAPQRCLQIENLDGCAMQVWVAADTAADEVISIAVGSALCLPVDQSGTIEGWYRLTQNGKLVPLETPARALTGSGLGVRWIPAETRLVELTVTGGGKDVCFSSAMSTTVPVASLLRHLIRWLALSGSGWCLVAEGRVVGGHRILDDLLGKGVLALVLRQAP